MLKRNRDIRWSLPLFARRPPPPTGGKLNIHAMTRPLLRPHPGHIPPSLAVCPRSASGKEGRGIENRLCAGSSPRCPRVHCRIPLITLEASLSDPISWRRKRRLREAAQRASGQSQGLNYPVPNYKWDTRISGHQDRATSAVGGACHRPLALDKPLKSSEPRFPASKARMIAGLAPRVRVRQSRRGPGRGARLS